MAVAVGGEDQIVQPLEGLAVARGENRLDFARRRIEQQKAELVVGDVDASVAMDLQAVGPAVILDDELAFELRRQAEDAAERDVDEIEIAVAVEARPFEERIDLLAEPVGVGPCGALRAAKAVGQADMNLGLDANWRREDEHGAPLSSANARREPTARLREGKEGGQRRH